MAGWWCFPRTTRLLTSAWGQEFSEANGDVLRVDASRWSLEEARQVIGAFIERYNRGWLLERHG